MTTPVGIAPDPLAAVSPLMKWLLERCAPDDAALAQVHPQITLDGLYAAWLTGEQTASAIRLIAAVLPARESIWWAWVSARHATQVSGGAPATAAVHAALAAVERWIVQPDEDHRRAAWEAGNAAGLEAPIGMIASAVFLSGTTVGPAHLPPVPPPPGATMALVAGAILLAGTSVGEASQVTATLAAFAAQGLEIIKRLGGWDSVLPAAYDRQLRAEHEYARQSAAPAAGRA